VVRRDRVTVPVTASPIQSAIFGRCPRCGEKTLFRNFVAFADKCEPCGLDYTKFNVGDGPVVFLTMGIGAIVVLLAVSVELAFSPGILIHALLWIPLTTLLVVLALRFAKGLLLALEYKNAAREGRIKRE
jgi:uncharacterized protein (DUF983 family)